jgi:hypothetical protein
MAKKILCGMIIAMVVLGVSMLTFNARLVRASGSRYDLNGDGVIDGADLAIVAKAFGSHCANFQGDGLPASPNWNPACDFNGDGQVNALDLALLVENFGETVS